MASKSSQQLTDRGEIPDSEDNSPIDVNSPDEMLRVAAPSAAPQKVATKNAASDLVADVGSRTATDILEKGPSPSPRNLELQRKITQLGSTIEHTELQMAEALSKLSTLSSFQEQSSTTSPSRAPSTHSNAMADLSLDQQRTLALAQNTLDRHIEQLGKYNQLKDIAMGMLGIIAEREGKTLREVMQARDVEDDD